MKFTFSMFSLSVVTHWHAYCCYEVGAIRIFLNLSKNYRKHCLRIICFLNNKHHKIGTMTVFSTLTPCKRLDRWNCSSMPIVRLLTQDEHSEKDTWYNPVRMIKHRLPARPRCTPLSRWHIHYTVLWTPYLLVRMPRPTSVYAIFTTLFSVFSFLDYNIGEVQAWA